MYGVCLLCDIGAVKPLCIGAVEPLNTCVDVFDSACPVHVSGWWMPLINRIVVRLRFLISILICTYGYLRVSSTSLETDILYFTFKIFSYYVLVLHLADDGFAFV